MSDRRLERALAELELARRRRELLFWTLRSWLRIVVLLALTIALLAVLAEGRLQGQLAAGAGALGAGALGVRRRNR